MFAVGQIPEGVQSTSFGFFLLFFYNQVLGLSGFLASLAIILAILVDAIVSSVLGLMAFVIDGGDATLLCMLGLSPSRSAFTACSHLLTRYQKPKLFFGY
jgi:hypothetical protein